MQSIQVWILCDNNCWYTMEDFQSKINQLLNNQLLKNCLKNINVYIPMMKVEWDTLKKCAFIQTLYNGGRITYTQEFSSLDEAKLMASDMVNSE